MLAVERYSFERVETMSNRLSLGGMRLFFVLIGLYYQLYRMDRLLKSIVVTQDSREALEEKLLKLDDILENLEQKEIKQNSLTHFLFERVLKLLTTMVFELSNKIADSLLEDYQK